jgi:hypothetical protein
MIDDQLAAYPPTTDDGRLWHARRCLANAVAQLDEAVGFLRDVEGQDDVVRSIKRHLIDAQGIVGIVMDALVDVTER